MWLITTSGASLPGNMARPVLWVCRMCRVVFHQSESMSCISTVNVSSQDPVTVGTWKVIFRLSKCELKEDYQLKFASHIEGIMKTQWHNALDLVISQESHNLRKQVSLPLIWFTSKPIKGVLSHIASKLLVAWSVMYRFLTLSRWAVMIIASLPVKMNVC